MVVIIFWWWDGLPKERWSTDEEGSLQQHPCWASASRTDVKKGSKLCSWNQVIWTHFCYPFAKAQSLSHTKTSFYLVKCSDHPCELLVSIGQIIGVLAVRYQYHASVWHWRCTGPRVLKYRQMFGNTTASSWFIDWFQDPFLIRMQDACFYVWGLGTRSSQRKTGDESGIGERSGRASSTDVCVCYTASRSRSPWHAVPLLLIQGLRRKELAADEGKGKWVQQKSREWFPQNTWFYCSEDWPLMCVR